jgi:hypothetical protein
MSSTKQERLGEYNIMFNYTEGKRGDIRMLVFNGTKQDNNALKQEIRSVVALKD